MSWAGKTFRKAWPRVLLVVFPVALNNPCGRVFKTTRTMLTQATDMVVNVTNFPGTITVHGDGLMQQMCEDMKNSGAMEILAREEARQITGMNRKQRRAMR